MRVPRPAASTIARCGIIASDPAAARFAPSYIAGGHIGGVPVVRAAPAPDAPASAADSPICAACDANIAACRRAGRGGRRCRGSWWRAAPPASRRAGRSRRRRSSRSASRRARDVAAEQRDLQRLRHVDAGILQQRGEVVGRRAHHGVLEIEQADAGDVLAVRQPEQIGRMDSRAAPRSAARRAPAAARRATARRRRRARRRSAARRRCGRYQSSSSSASIRNASRS